jgi:hypothetical protein
MSFLVRCLVFCDSDTSEGIIFLLILSPAMKIAFVLATIAVAVSASEWECNVGDSVSCPGGEMCAGSQCCRDGTTCPSADPSFQGCPKPKSNACTQAHCNVGDTVPCPSGEMCAGSQCCRDGTTCPSADPSFQGCSKPKTTDCTAFVLATTAVAVSASEWECNVGDSVPCPSGEMCAGNQCCRDGTTCPSADPSFQGCPKPKTTDCTQAAAHCNVGDSVPCPSGEMCAGSQCCRDGTTCPSADPSFQGCPKPKTTDCTQVVLV